MKQVIQLLEANPQISNYKINIHKKESYELFFVKGKLETLRRTDTCDKEVTVYVDHGEYTGDAQFFLYPSTTADQLSRLIDEAAAKAKLICNQRYTLPQGETGDFTVESNFSQYSPEMLAARIAESVFGCNTLENASLNSVEIFLNRHTETVCNSLGVRKTQVRYDAMVETIPTYNGPNQSVELYGQYNFSDFSLEDLEARVSRELAHAKARYEAFAPDHPLDCPVILNIQEVAQLYSAIARNLNYATVHSHSNLFSKGDAIQKAPVGDRIGITMAGQVPGCVSSSCFDGDGLSLGSRRLVEQGTAIGYYGSNRYAQYLGETPTGSLPCLIADTGSAQAPEGPWLEVVSMSGLQVDFFNDYIGGEVRLAYYHDGEKTVSLTGLSISGKLSRVLESITLSSQTGIYNSYCGPEKAILKEMSIF